MKDFATLHKLSRQPKMDFLHGGERTIKGDWDSTTYCGFDAYFGLCQVRRGGVVRVGDQDLSLGVIGTDPNDEKG